MITTIIGLNEISSGRVTSKPGSLNASWDPQNPIASAERSRNFVQNLFLISAVESLDYYLKIINRAPKPKFPTELQKILDGAGMKLQLRTIEIGRHFGIDQTLIALMELVIKWRNCIAHPFAEKLLQPENKSHLISEKDQIEEDYNGLDIELCIVNAEKGADIHFKEVASLTKATHKFIENIDREFIELYKGDLQKIIFELVKNELKANQTFRQKYYSRQESKLKYLISNLIANKIGSFDYDWLEGCVKIEKRELDLDF